MKKSHLHLIRFFKILFVLALVGNTIFSICFRIAFRNYFSPSESRKNYNILRIKVIKTYKNVSLVTYRLIFDNSEGRFGYGVEKIEDFIFYSEPMCISYLVKDFKAYSINDAYNSGIVTLEEIKVFHDANTKYINSKHYFDPYPNEYKGPVFHTKEVFL